MSETAIIFGQEPDLRPASPQVTISCPCCGGEMKSIPDLVFVGETDVFWKGTRLMLQPISVKVLFHLTKRMGQTVSRKLLYDELYWDRADGGPFEKIMDVHVSYLRKRLALLGVPIVLATVWSVGWRLERLDAKLIKGEGLARREEA